MSPDPRSTCALRWTVLVLVLLALLVFTSLAPVLVLGAWCAAIARPTQVRLARALGGRHRASAAVAVLVLVLLALPLSIVFASLAPAAVQLLQQLAESPGVRGALSRIVSDGTNGQLPASGFGLGDLAGLAGRHGLQAWRALQLLAGATIKIFVGLVLFLLVTYSLLADNEQLSLWAEEHAPVRPAHLRRLVDAFTETGRGLLVGVLLTALTQGGVATAVYLGLRIPSALVLGLLTGLAALVPLVGTALVWVPVSIGLAITGRWVAALVLGALGLLVIGTIDNFLRPIYARYGRLQLPTPLVVLAVFGGIWAVGLWGAALGPLVVRLAMEALRIAREEGLVGPGRALATPAAADPD